MDNVVHKRRLAADRGTEVARRHTVMRSLPAGQAGDGQPEMRIVSRSAGGRRA
jgi:hypothetical protein